MLFLFYVSNAIGRVRVFLPRVAPVSRKGSPRSRSAITALISSRSLRGSKFCNNMFTMSGLLCVTVDMIVTQTLRNRQAVFGCANLRGTMGFRFHRRITFGRHFRINVSKSGVSESIGTRGAWFTVGRRGARDGRTSGQRTQLHADVAQRRRSARNRRSIGAGADRWRGSDVRVHRPRTRRLRPAHEPFRRSDRLGDGMASFRKIGVRAIASAAIGSAIALSNTRAPW